jgi:asparagine synthase (glutamine-hydrolysing)
MQAQSDRPVRTFTIGFEQAGYNEAEQAKAVARHLGTDHAEHYVTSDEALGVIPRLPAIYDEPFSDSSQIPTLLVSQLARGHVTVALTGDGADESAAGYNRHFQAPRFLRLSKVPFGVRQLAAAGLRELRPETLDAIFDRVGLGMRRRSATGLSGYRMHKLASTLALREPRQMYRHFLTHWEAPTEIVIDGQEPLTAVTDVCHYPTIGSFVHWMMWLDTETYLPDDILVKVDRASMAVSLETRCPFLDHRVVEFLWRMPLSMKIQNNVGKHIIRRVLDRYLPRYLYDRPKQGFGVPMGEWLRGPLRAWAEDLLDEARLRREGFFRPEPIRRRWAEHTAGSHNWGYHLWDVLMFQAWLAHWGGSD